MVFRCCCLPLDSAVQRNSSCIVAKRGKETKPWQIRRCIRLEIPTESITFVNDCHRISPEDLYRKDRCQSLLQLFASKVPSSKCKWLKDLFGCKIYGSIWFQDRIQLNESLFKQMTNLQVEGPCLLLCLSNACKFNKIWLRIDSIFDKMTLQWLASAFK